MAVSIFRGAPCTTEENQPLFLSVIEHDGAAKVRECKTVCAPCPRKRECLALGMWDGEVLDGVYGGLSKRERTPKPPCDGPCVLTGQFDSNCGH